VAGGPGVRHVAQLPQEFQRLAQRVARRLLMVPGPQRRPRSAAVILVVDPHDRVPAEVDLVPARGRLDEALAGLVTQELQHLTARGREILPW
jgi:hypothetical protein